MGFSEDLISWYDKNKRSLPWRETREPYIRWISEIILQQTRIDQGTAYYHNFLESFQTIDLLAAAEEHVVLKLWEGLGYYSRARNLHKTAKIISENMNGHFPEKYVDLLKLPGVGPYTASALASICFNEIQPTIDGNVYRFLSRYLGIKEAINSSKAYKIFHAYALNLISPKRPGDFNEAMMEFGALVCKKKPTCEACPFHRECFAFLRKKVNEFPYKTKKPKKKKRYLHFLFLEKENRILLEKRVAEDIWFHLYQFPLLELNEKQQVFNELQHSSNKKLTQNSIVLIHEEKHLLTHQELYISIYGVKSTQLYSHFLNKSNIFEIEAMEIIENYSLPKPLKKFINLYYGN